MVGTTYARASLCCVILLCSNIGNSSYRVIKLSAAIRKNCCARYRR